MFFTLGSKFGASLRFQYADLWWAGRRVCRECRAGISSAGGDRPVPPTVATSQFMILCGNCNWNIKLLYNHAQVRAIIPKIRGVVWGIGVQVPHAGYYTMRSVLATYLKKYLRRRPSLVVKKSINAIWKFEERTSAFHSICPKKEGGGGSVICKGW